MGVSPGHWWGAPAGGQGWELDGGTASWWFCVCHSLWSPSACAVVFSQQGSQDICPCFSWWCLALERQEVTQSLPQVCLLESRWHGHRVGLQTCKRMGWTRSFLAPSTPLARCCCSLGTIFLLATLPTSVPISVVESGQIFVPVGTITADPLLFL